MYTWNDEEDLLLFDGELRIILQAIYDAQAYFAISFLVMFEPWNKEEST
jgi:hypothetical protein